MIFVNSNGARTQWFYFFASMLFVMRQKSHSLRVLFFMSIFGIFSRAFFSRCFYPPHFCLFKWNFVWLHDRDVQLIDWLLIFKYYGISKYTQILCLLTVEDNFYSICFFRWFAMHLPPRWSWLSCFAYKMINCLDCLLVNFPRYTDFQR